MSILGFLGENWLTLSIAVISFSFAYYFYRNSTQTGKPVYLKHATRLLGRKENNLPDRVSVLFDGHEVERLTKTTLIFWNNGNQVLHGKDIVDSVPLKISFDEDSNILSLNILAKTKEENGVKINLDNHSRNYVLLSFEYLDPNDGVVFELLHNSVRGYPTVSGSIKGVPDGIKDLGLFSFSDFTERKSFIGVLVIGACLALVGMPSWILREELSTTWLSSVMGYLSIAFLIGTTITVYTIVMLFIKRRKYPKSLEVYNFIK